MGKILARVSRRGAQAQINHVSTVPGRTAAAPVARVYAQVEREFGMLAPPVSLHAPAPGPLAASWVMLRETLLATGRADRATKEAVAATVSRANACPYCVDVHGSMLHGLLGGSEANAVGADGLDSITDPALRAVVGWARGSGRAELPAEQVAELVGVAVTFHYLNRMVNVFLSDSPFPPKLPAAARAGLKRLAGRLLRPTALELRAPGMSLDLLPAAPPPGDLDWAAGAPIIEDAFARATAAVEAAGRSSVPEPVRALVLARLDERAGEPAGLGPAWVEDAVAGLPAADRPPGRLALLTALASYRVTQAVIDDFRRDRPEDAELIALTSWASLAAARREGGRMHAAVRSTHHPVPLPRRGET